MAGVGAVIAKSFSRLYFRNCINSGLPVIVAPDAVEAIENGEELTVDLDKGELTCGAGTFNFPPLPDEVKGIFEEGGLIAYTK